MFKRANVRVKYACLKLDKGQGHTFLIVVGSNLVVHFGIYWLKTECVIVFMGGHIIYKP